MEREFIDSFEGPHGKAEIYEVISHPSGGMGVEKVEYEVSMGGEKHIVLSMGEASILACQLSGNERFMNRA